MKGYDDFFIVKKENTVDFLDFKFLVKAVSKDCARFFLQFVFCEKEGDDLVMVATDGHRMHLLRPNNPELYGIKEGYYQVLANTTREIVFAHCDDNLSEEDVNCIDHGKFPAYQDAIPSSKIRDTIERLSFRKSKTFDVRNLVTFSKKLDTDTSMNINYLYDLSPFDWNVSFYDYEEGHKPVNFISTNKQAVIMPINEA